MPNIILITIRASHNNSSYLLIFTFIRQNSELQTHGITLIPLIPTELKNIIHEFAIAGHDAMRYVST